VSQRAGSELTQQTEEENTDPALAVLNDSFSSSVEEGEPKENAPQELKVGRQTRHASKFPNIRERSAGDEAEEKTRVLGWEGVATEQAPNRWREG